MKNFVTAVVLLAGGVWAVRTDAEYESQFEAFIVKYGKSYADAAERAHRLDAFKATVDRVDAFYANGVKRSYNVGINKFSDLTRQEFLSTYVGRGFRPSSATFASGPAVHRRVQDPLPEAFDWRKFGVVSGVKDQGQCGSCWSFSATGAIEGAYGLASNQTGKQLAVCSEQQILDCSWGAPYNNTGCDGGDPRSALQYVIDNKGIDSEKSYPYIDGAAPEAGAHKCKYNPADKVANISSMVFVQSGNETDLQYAAFAAPVSVAIDASQDSFQDYTDGVYDEPLCGNKMQDLDHGVLVVGWGAAGTKPRAEKWWIVKNSWGEGWGQDGYIWMLKDVNNQCGIATYATYAITA